MSDGGDSPPCGISSGMPPLELLVSHVTIDVPDGFDRHVVYVDVKWRSRSFRTTAKAKRFDPLNPKAQHVDFDSDQALLTAPPPLTSGDVLQVRGRHCDVFGDRDFQHCAVPLLRLPLFRGEPLSVRAGIVTLRLKAINFGLERSAHEGGASASPSDGISGMLDLSNPEWEERAAELRRRFEPRCNVPLGREGETAVDNPYPATEGDAQTDLETPPVAAAVVGVGAPPPAAPTEEGGSCGNISGGETRQLEIVTHADAIGPLSWTGEPPSPPSPRVPVRGPGGAPQAARVSGGPRKLFGLIAGAVRSGASEVRGAACAAMLRQHFPELAAEPVEAAFTSCMLNGHGTPIPGSLYITRNHVAFHGPMMRFVVPFSEVVHVRRVRVFSDAALQVFARRGSRGGGDVGHPSVQNIVMQLQGFDGVVSRLGSTLGVRSEEKIAEAYRTIVQHWRER